MKLKNKIFALLALMGLSAPVLTSCSDEPDSEYLYSFTGEMMSDYLKNRSQYSDFTTIVQRAGMMDLLSSYGTYTCFAPTNEAVAAYLQKHNKASIDDLSEAECDTIARTHLASTIYSTYDLNNGFTNMNRRYIKAETVSDDNNNSVIELNSQAIINYATQNDSVENGIVQPISQMLESDTRMVNELIKINPRLSLYYLALQRTGIDKVLQKFQDENYEQDEYQYRYKSGSEPTETAIAPPEKRYGFTAFMVPNDVLLAKGYIQTDPASNAEQALRELYQLAKSIYDVTFPNDKDKDGTSFDQLDNPINPLYRFMAYHILPRSVEEPSFLTVRNDAGIYTDIMNPTEWYETMLPYTMMKVEKYTVDLSGLGTTAVKNNHYLNRRFDKWNSIEGAHVDYNVENGLTNNSLNGYYFYIDDIVAFNEQTRDVVDNVRMRVDMSALFPEMMTNGHRMNGDYTIHQQDKYINNNPAVGDNYYYPAGYLTGVTMRGQGYFVYRHPRCGYWSYNGDEMITQGNFDVSFRIPPVPVAGMYQVRLGYAAMAGIRTICQFYFGTDTVPDYPVGAPVDMDVQMNNAQLLGTDFEVKYSSGSSDYSGYKAVRDQAYNDDGTVKDEDAAAVLTRDQKVLKNKGFYRGAYGCGCGTYSDSKTSHADEVRSKFTHFAAIANTFRIVITQQYMEPGKYYYVRIRKATKEKRGNDECMLDYIEVVPKSVYGVSDGEQREDDL